MRTIYEPQGRAREYSPLALNHYQGCDHACTYCYARSINRRWGKDWPDEKKVDLVIYHQTLRPLFDMLGVCRLPWIEIGLNEQHYENFYNYVTGGKTSLSQLLEKSNKIYNLTRLINARLGMSRKDDIIPYKVHSCPVQTGATAGKVVKQEDFERLLDLYYRKRGWDENGIPLAEGPD